VKNAIESVKLVASACRLFAAPALNRYIGCDKAAEIFKEVRRFGPLTARAGGGGAFRGRLTLLAERARQTRLGQEEGPPGGGPSSARSLVRCSYDPTV
jgi:hypothetical protein